MTSDHGKPPFSMGNGFNGQSEIQQTDLARIVSKRTRGIPDRTDGRRKANRIVFSGDNVPIVL